MIISRIQLYRLLCLLKRLTHTSRRRLIVDAKYKGLFLEKGSQINRVTITTSPVDNEPGAIFSFEDPERAIAYLENLSNLRLWKIKQRRLLPN